MEGGGISSDGDVGGGSNSSSSSNKKLRNVRGEQGYGCTASMLHGGLQVHGRNVTNQQDIYPGTYTTPAPL